MVCNLINNKDIENAYFEAFGDYIFREPEASFPYVENREKKMVYWLYTKTDEEILDIIERSKIANRNLFFDELEGFSTE